LPVPSRACAQQARAENSFGNKVRRLVFSDANFLDDAQARGGAAGARGAQAARACGRAFAAAPV
jgi:hypothetical protein